MRLSPLFSLGASAWLMLGCGCGLLDPFNPAALADALAPTGSMAASGAGFSGAPPSGGDGSQESAPAIVAPSDGSWTWVDVDGAVCGNGGATGFAVNLQANSDSLVLFFAGGGVCDSALTCGSLNTATYVGSGYVEANFRQDATEEAALRQLWLTRRDGPTAPFAGANLAYVPYCTGDLHAGLNVVTYDGMRAPIHHVGAKNVRLLLRRLAATLPQIRTLWLVGVSAGGFATLLNQPSAASAFPQARLNLLDDSGISFAGVAAAPAWNLQLPADCPRCGDDLSALVPRLVQQNPSLRLGLLAYARDSVLPSFFDTAPDAFAAQLAAFAAQKPARVQTFIVPGQGHGVVLAPQNSAGGLGVIDWVQRMVDGAESWISAP